MKRRAKFLPLVLAVPLLVGCGTKKLSDPKFADMGEKKSFEDFAEAITKASESAAFNKEDEKLGSFSMKKTAGFEIKSNITRGKETLAKGTYTSVSEITTDFSSADKLLASKEESSLTSSSEAKEGKASSKTTTKKDGIIQVGQYSGANYILSVDNVRKEYHPYQLLSDEVKAEDVYDTDVKDLFKNMSSGITSAINRYVAIDYDSTKTEDEKKAEKDKYAFYMSGNIFTLTYTDKVVDKEHKVMVGEEEKVAYKETSSDIRKYQVDFTAEKLAYRESVELVEKTTFLMEYEYGGTDVAAGDVVDYSEKDVEEAEADMKATPKLKAVDLAKSKYEAIGFDAKSGLK